MAVNAIGQGSKKAVSMVGYLLYIVSVVIALDVVVFNKLFGFGHPRHYEQENLLRYPAPYVAFTGRPLVLDHNEFGFRGPSFEAARSDELRIAFFGGSTGYEGHPSIARILEARLEERLNENVFVANYSVVSSNHRQHLHGIIEYLPAFQPDLVIFYGGYNETVAHALYDPRPGYPYNHFYRAETGPWVKLLLENSGIVGEIDSSRGTVSGLDRLRSEQQPFSDDWNRRIADKYFETLMLAEKVAGTIGSSRFGATKFLAFYQPYQVPDLFRSTHDEITARIDRLSYVFDVSSAYDVLGKDVYRDPVHVAQAANALMGGRIADIVAREISGEAVADATL